METKDVNTEDSQTAHPDHPKGKLGVNKLLPLQLPQSSDPQQTPNAWSGAHSQHTRHLRETSNVEESKTNRTKAIWRKRNHVQEKKSIFCKTAIKE